VNRQFLHFQSDTESQLLPLGMVVEVIPMVHLDYEEEEGNELYRGILNFRGDMIPVFQLEGEGEGNANSNLLDYFLIIVNIEENDKIALLVREIYGVIEAEERSYSEVETGGAFPVLVAEIKGQLTRIFHPPLLRKSLYVSSVDQKV